MWQRPHKISHQDQQKQQQNEDTNNPVIECADLILPWLTPPELANISLTCKTLNQISKSITLHRSLDASGSLEDIPIPFHNSVDHHLYAYFIYSPSQILPSSLSQPPPRQSWGPTLDPITSSPSRLRSDGVSQRGAESVSGSTGIFLGVTGSASAGQSRLGARWVSLVDESGENVSGCHCEKCEDVGDDDRFGCPCLGLDGLGIVNECGPSCRCGLECGNRSTQRGISVRLKIVRDGRKGWGLYADQLIQQGQFVCEYAGELLTTEEARRRQQVYDKLTLGGRFYSALLVVREHLPSGKACLRINIDATRVGNVARFINHSCDGGNLSTVLARSTGSLLPRLCFFASKDIKQDEELTFSYGDIRVRSNGLRCFCGNSCCFGVLPSEHT